MESVARSAGGASPKRSPVSAGVSIVDLTVCLGVCLSTEICGCQGTSGGHLRVSYRDMYLGITDVASLLLLGNIAHSSHSVCLSFSSR